MDSDFSAGETSGYGSVDPDFGFAFDDSNFSDRILRIEIMPDCPKLNPTVMVAPLSLIGRVIERRREDFKKENDFIVQSEEQILNCKMPYTVDGVTYVNQDEEPMSIAEVTF
ncbi:BTB/POZ domain-containing protein POB1-like [Hibiscus syriacus]|uniref:BTB/POZ domain-containing protein POB1-like n=1 Tax=Hibiscus syriacus TaxID=106335 RepID=UPI0019206E6B|nr:BTB/POZ domain-containing protein POB1-like [Hibiscus syriacus]